MASESDLGYLIPGLTQISSMSLTLYNLPVILWRHKILHYERKSAALIITNKMLEYFRGTKYQFFLPPYQLTFFLDFGQKSFFGSCSRILMNFPSMNYSNYFVTILQKERFTNLQTTFEREK